MPHVFPPPEVLYQLGGVPPALSQCLCMWHGHLGRAGEAREKKIANCVRFSVGSIPRTRAHARIETEQAPRFLWHGRPRP
jgi:hypothetical protein